MSHIIPLSASEIEARLLKIPELVPNIFCTGTKEIINGQDCIVVEVDQDITSGLEVKFRSPVACTDVLRLCVRQCGTENYKIFAFADANGNDVGEIDSLFAADAVVKVILDLGTGIAEVDGAAFVQNANTNTYLESRFADMVDFVVQHVDNKSNIQIITWEAAD
jgi:hypothetical protein